MNKMNQEDSSVKESQKFIIFVSLNLISLKDQIIFLNLYVHIHIIH
jgi:hypothetical protein